MYYEAHPDVLRQVVAERHESLRRQTYVARLRRAVRAEARQRRRERRVERARRREHRPHLVAPPPALAE